ncbi:hypothetical protein GQ44DRAFT_398883 [Phaeosphaeriaceae sp. PMI808]|nr:hypothetical protein GQ44DRAFT_398883 [Phaeosphaeriaceae sp. PMI808]
MSATEERAWYLVSSAWRAAVVIIVLRYLFFGLPDPEVTSRSPTPTLATQEFNAYDTSEDVIQSTDGVFMNFQPQGASETQFDTEHLSAELYRVNPFSRIPSPMPSPRPSSQRITFDHWHRRYEIHNDAISDLFHSLQEISALDEVSYLRYSLTPLMILALVSQAGSNERALCISQFDRFERYIRQEGAAPNPVGGSALNFDIPWDHLDMFSLEMEQLRRDNNPFLEPQLRNTAPEWNWYAMLKRTELKPDCE